MTQKRGLVLALSLAGASLAGFAIPALAQQNEAAQPPAKTPAKTPAKAPAKAPTKAAPPKTDTPKADPPTGSSGSTVADDDVPDIELDLPVKTEPADRPAPKAPTESSSSDDEEDDNADGLSTVVPGGLDVPTRSRRSLENVGIIDQNENGYRADAFGNRDGRYLLAVAKSMRGPLVSRWGGIMGRRLLASRTDTPENIVPQEWVAARSYLLLTMGEANTARALIQQVDTSQYDETLLRMAMPIYLANADPAGTCSMVDRGARVTKAKSWRLMRGVCAALAGEQGRSSALMSAARQQGLSGGIDYLLAMKVVGAGNKRGAVQLSWDKVDKISVWRHGLALTVGVTPPESLYDDTGRQVSGWFATAPMLPARERADYAIEAAALGVFSNDALVSLFAAAAADPEVDSRIETRADWLRDAYVGSGRSDRIAAMRKLWDESKQENLRYGYMVLTSRAAGAIAPNGDVDGDDKDALIASMLTSGLDRQAAKWSGVVDAGSLAWGLIAAAAPENRYKIDADSIDSFKDNDGSENFKKTKLLLAGLTGLGRISADDANAAARDIGFALSRKTRYVRNVDTAAKRQELGTVGLLALAALQGKDWSTVAPYQFYHLIRAMRQVGLEAEARMIVAEAVTRA